MTKIESRIAMIENSLKQNADVMTADQIASLKKTLDALRAQTATPAIEAAAVQVVETVETKREATVEDAAAVTVLATVESPKVAAENARREKSGKPKMTAAEAKRFEMYSVNNAAKAEGDLQERNGCECEAYVDIFTFGRWIAQGFAVRKGEKSTRVPVIKSKKVVDSKTGEEKWIKTTNFVPVFCRCQVEKIKAKKAAA